MDFNGADAVGRDAGLLQAAVNQLGQNGGIGIGQIAAVGGGGGGDDAAAFFVWTAALQRQTGQSFAQHHAGAA